MPVVGLVTWPKLRGVDDRAVVPGPELELLRRISIFAPLPEYVLEQLAWNAVHVGAGAGDVLIREGDPGDRFYLVVEGTVQVSVAGRAVAEIGPGGYFGEIALLRNVPRTATVTASSPVALLAVEREQFLTAVTGSRSSAMAANRAVDERVDEVEAVARRARGARRIGLGPSQNRNNLHRTIPRGIPNDRVEPLSPNEEASSPPLEAFSSFEGFPRTGRGITHGRIAG